MKNAILGLAVVAALASASQAALVINEVYPGGGSGTASTLYTRDFVEIYNTSSSPVSLTGYSLQYASANGGFTNLIVAFGPGSVIGANDYLSVATGNAGAAGATLTAPTNVTYVVPGTGASLSATSGAVRLFDGTAAVDILGYGAVVSPGSNGDIKVEGTAATALAAGNTLSFNRTGFVDTNNNSADFSAATPSPNPGTASLVVIPEPTTLGLLAGMGVIALRRRSVR